MTKLHNKKGFTLIELMVVIVIVGILAAVAIPKFSMASHKAKASEFPTVLMAIFTAEGTYEQETGIYSATFSSIGLDDPSTPSKYFAYTITGIDNTSNPKTFTGNATIKNAGFGDASSGDAATITHLQAKSGDTDLTQYTNNWP